MSGAGLARKRFSWRKLSSAKWSDSWLERLAFLGPGRVLVIEFPGARTVRVEAHGLSAREAEAVRKMFGGMVREARWLTAVEPPLRPPIRVRGKLLIVSTPAEVRKADPAGPAPLLIPAGMAFGTGEHATTAACLRLLADAAHPLGEGTWDLLDLGTGSGILALAAEKLGARSVLAVDFDPHAVRTARANLRANASRRVRVQRLDVRTWSPDQTYPLITANLFSGLLIETAPKIVRALAPGGRLVFSGVLREQEAEVLAAWRGQRLRIEKVVRRGKWIAGLCRRPRGKTR